MNNTNERCTCGDTGSTFYPDENQYEPNCWDCYHQMQEYDPDGADAASTGLPPEENLADLTNDVWADDLPF